MSEVWRPVPNYENHYEASSLGRIRRSAPSRNGYIGRLLKPEVVKDGYQRVILSAYGKTKRFSVHKLILLTFVGPRPPDHECNHKDGVPNNNKLTNLEWVTKEANAQHKHHVLGSCIGRNHHNTIARTALSPNGKRIKIYGLERFCKRHGLEYGSMWKVLQGLREQHRGWRKAQ